MGTYRLAVRQLVYDPSVVTDELVQVFVEMSSQPGASDAHRRVLRTGVDWRGMKRAALDEIRGSAHAIRAPTLIIWGLQDRVVPVAHAHIARKIIPNAQMHIFDKCGHAPMIEKANEFNSLVTKFVVDYSTPEIAARTPAN
jgi:pimeloyl-ACP methyl ester carboxylesterase